jgi:hypothetical protein
VLLARGLASSADAAVEMIRLRRPKIRLNRVQRAFLVQIAGTLSQARAEQENEND